MMGQWNFIKYKHLEWKHEDPRWALVFHGASLDEKQFRTRTGLSSLELDFDEARFDAHNGEILFYKNGNHILFSMLLSVNIQIVSSPTFVWCDSEIVRNDPT